MHSLLYRDVKQGTMTWKILEAFLLLSPLLDIWYKHRALYPYRQYLISCLQSAILLSGSTNNVPNKTPSYSVRPSRQSEAKASWTFYQLYVQNLPQTKWE